MNDPKPSFNFHASIENLFKYWKKDPEFKHVILSYGISQFPWAEMKSNMGDEDIVQIPLPSRFYPYASWKDWFSNYLEDQTQLVADEVKVKVFKVREDGRKTELIPLNRKPIIEIPSNQLDPLLG